MNINFPNIKILKEIYKTKNSTILLIEDNNEYISKNENNISLFKCVNKNILGDKQYEMLKREKEFYTKNTLKYFPKFIKAYGNEDYLIMEITFIEGLNMSYLLLNNLLNFQKNSINLYKNFLTQIIYLLERRHSKKYIYRDLKLNNLIINKNLEIFFVDFGFCKQFNNYSDRTNTICGTIHTKAPEILQTKYKKINDYNGFYVDIYTLGILMYEIYYGKAPFDYFLNNISQIEYDEKILKGINDSFFEKDIDKNLKDLIMNCMNVDPKKRLNLKEIKEHKFFENCFDNYLNLNNVLIDSKNEDNYIKTIINEIELNGIYKNNYLHLEEKKFVDDLFNQFI